MRSERRVLTVASALCAFAGLGLCSVVACSDGTDLTYQVNGNTADPATPEGVLTGSPVPGGDVFSGPTPGEGSAAVPPASGAGASPPTENPPPVQAPPEEAPPASGGEPQPNATETNFFSAGCRSDADCGENRRCELPVDAGAGAAPGPAREDVAPPDAGADAAVPETVVPRGHCVAL